MNAWHFHPERLKPWYGEHQGYKFRGIYFAKYYGGVEEEGGGRNGCCGKNLKVKNEVFNQKEIRF